MNATEGITGLLLRLWHHLSKRHKRQIVTLLGLMLVSAFAEVVSLGAVLPFLGILTAPEQVFKYPVVADLARAWGIASPHQMILPLTLSFATAALLAGAIRLLFLWVNVRVSNECGVDFCLDVFIRTLNQPYSVHVARNSSTVISGISKVTVIQSVIWILLNVTCSTVLSVSIILALLVVNAKVTMMAALGFGVSYGMIIRFSRRRLERNSVHVAHEQTRMIKTLQEGLGGIRDILLDGTQAAYADIYHNSLLATARATGSNQIIGTGPRYILEAIGMVLIAFLAYFLDLQHGGIAMAMPVLGALAIGAQRILPAIQQLYSGWTTIAGNRASLSDALELLDQPMPPISSDVESEPLAFREGIRFEHVGFQYGERSAKVLDGLDFSIPKGARVGFVGGTGSGKSTALDLLMGLLEPTEGRILVDGMPIHGGCRRAWQRSIAHVPQNIFLADASFAENIAFGVKIEDIDMARIEAVARQARIADFVKGLPDGYSTLVGERGARLSGGQRQRIGIARALYKRASVLILDEATSALDNVTEQAVVDSIGALDQALTVIIVAHRLGTVRHCDIIFELNHGRMVAQGAFEHLVEHSPSFREMARVVV